MGSVLTTRDPSKKDAKKILSQGKPNWQFIQFVPGITKRVIVNAKSVGYTKEADINSIYAKPHISGNRIDADNDGLQYFPLLRGMVDVPTPGDPVLLCTFGDTRYYLGPVNTHNNVGFNKDEDYIPFALEKSLDLTDFNNEYVKSFDFRLPFDDYSYDFPKSKHKRLTKEFIPILDQNGNTYESLMNPMPASKRFPIHGDMIFEGRHGNSLRLGSRDVAPYTFLSNGRREGSVGQEESLYEGSLIAITSKHSVRKWFSPSLGRDGGPVWDFIFASDLRNNIYPDYMKPTESDPEYVPVVFKNRYRLDHIYIGEQFDNNQIFITSDGISLNSRTQSLVLSSFKNVYMAGGENVIIKAPQSVRINSESVILGGDTEKDPDENNFVHIGGSKNPDIDTAFLNSAVLGDRLVFILKEVIDLISNSQVMTQQGAQSLLTSDMLPLKPILDNIIIKLDKVLSEKVFITNNLDPDPELEQPAGPPDGGNSNVG